MSRFSAYYTGTGSGKTECFMIPVISNLVEESKSWPLPEEREHAVRTLIMYPLNALAEDQMVRLRKSLEDENVKKWFFNFVNRKLFQQLRIYKTFAKRTRK